ncbi:uncharacterized protein Dwil_GK28123 [Drosophila willistoni]|uniref:Chitin-binding type-2 domain-containing protein n=2 Tax=Drosophila willistoni TaxID=7260 RepID=A0A0Q9WZL6_DROWI|nr:uncharacterized protein Dwil_GK28123 [Drosophila willistoni]
MYIECPKNYRCTDGTYVCYPKASSTSACEINDSTTTTSVTTPSSDILSSSVGTTESTTTTAAPRDPTVMCQEVQATGFYQNELDSTCATYVYCRLVNNAYTATVRDCPSNQWYDATKKYCSTTKPDTCS